MWFGILATLVSLQAAPREPQSSSALSQAVASIAASGRCASVGEPPEARIAQGLVVAPGQPPMLSFRLYEGRVHHREIGTDLMLDDAGH